MNIKHIPLFIVFGLLVIGCQTNNAVSTETPSNSIGTFKVALLLPRTIDADGWNRSGYDGLLLIEKELGAEIAYTEAVPESDFETVFRQYAKDGYDFIIGHGAQFVTAAETVALEFPRTQFVVNTTYAGNNRNLGALSMREGEVAYLAGVIAALKTQTKHVGYLSGQSNRVNQEIAIIYERGAKATDPEITVSSVWTGSWTDEDKARELTQELIDDQVDVLVVLAGSVAPIVHARAEQAGIHTIGWTSDQHDLAPNAVITSVVENTPVMMLQGATLAQRGRWEGKQYLFGLLENVLYLTPFNGMLTLEQEAIIDNVKNDILSGEINTLP